MVRFYLYEYNERPSTSIPKAFDNIYGIELTIQHFLGFNFCWFFSFYFIFPSHYFVFHINIFWNLNEKLEIFYKILSASLVRWTKNSYNSSWRIFIILFSFIPIDLYLYKFLCCSVVFLLLHHHQTLLCPLANHTSWYGRGVVHKWHTPQEGEVRSRRSWHFMLKVLEQQNEEAGVDGED